KGVHRGCRSRSRVEGAQQEDQADPLPFPSKTPSRADVRKTRGGTPDVGPRIAAPSAAMDHDEASSPISRCGSGAIESCKQIVPHAREFFTGRSLSRGAVVKL